jgi:hypothetical protein
VCQPGTGWVWAKHRHGFGQHRHVGGGRDPRQRGDRAQRARRRRGACSPAHLQAQLMLGLTIGQRRGRPRPAEPAAGPHLDGEHIVELDNVAGFTEQ